MVVLRPVWADDVTPFEIDGSGAAGLNTDVVAWQNALYGATSPVDVGYVAEGDRDGRAKLLSGRTDFAISAEPFTDEELAQRPAGSAPLISAPMSVASISMLFGISPQLYQLRTYVPDGCDPNNPDVQCDPVDEPYMGGIRLPPQNLAALMVGWGGRSVFYDPTWSAAIGQPKLRLTSDDTQSLATFVYQLEGTSVNKYLLDYAQTIDPASWTQALTKAKSSKWNTAGERYPITSGQSPVGRGGYSTGVLAMFARPGFPNSDGDTGGGWGANSAAVNTDSVVRLESDRSSAQMIFTTASVKNAGGEYVLPTPAAVKAALDAGGATPNYAATHNVPGAYPMVYVNQIYAPSSGLTLEQTNAIAALIRYVATDGQKSVVDNGGVSLTPALQATALQQADALVASNCTGPDQMIVSGGPGPNEPATPGVAAIGTMKHCALKPPPETTTVPDTTVPDTAAADTTVADATTVPDTTTPDTTTTTTTTLARSTTTTSPRSTATTSTTMTSTTMTSTTAPLISDSAAAVPEETTAAETVAPETTAPDTEAPEPTEPVVTDPPSTRAVTYSTTLPMGQPPDGHGFKKLGTFMLGAIGFLLGRSIFLRRMSTP